MKKVLLRSCAGALLSLAILVGTPQTSSAAPLKGPYKQAVPEDFFDWSYAHKVWSEMNTWDKEEAEWAKYSSVFEPWLERYKNNVRAAMDELEKMPKDVRYKIQRGYDIQLAYEDWFDHVYSPWYNRYDYVSGNARREGKAAPTFDDYLAVWAKRESCVPERLLNQCGPIPDWRSPKWKEREQAMMQKVNADLDARTAAKKTAK